MPVSLVQRGPFSYDEYTNISSSDASTRTFTLTKAKFDPTIGEVLEVFVDGVKLVGDGTFVTGGSNPSSGASAHEFSVNSAKTQLTIVSDSDLASATDSAVTTVASGNDIIIRRVSNRTDKKIDFAPGSVIREADLDNANTQVFHVAQEAIDTALQAMGTDTDNVWNGESNGVNRKIKNVATPVSSDPDHYVVTKGYVDSALDNTATVRDSALDHRDTAESYATKIDGVVQHFSSASNGTSGPGVDQSGVYSSKEWAVGSHSGNTDGSSKQWALGGGTTFASGTAVSGSDYSAKEHAVGTTVTTGSSKAWATDPGSAQVASTDYSAKAWASDTANNIGSSKDWATKTDAVVASSDGSAKAWAIGGTGVTDTASKGAAKEWATETSSTVDTSEYSAKEYAQGTQVSTGGSAKNWASQVGADVTGASAGDKSAKSWAIETGGTAPADGSAKEWAITTGSAVASSEYSAKEYAQGTTVTGGSSKEWAQETSSAVDTTFSAKEYAQGSQSGTGGSAKNWATQTGADVTGASSGDMSSKEWAVGTLGRGVANEGSAKDWATYTSGTVDNADYSAKYWALDAEQSKLAAKASAAAVANVYDNFADTFLGSMADGASASSGSADGTWSASSSSITLANTSGTIEVGQEVTGTGIPTDANVLSVNGSTIVISENMTAAGSSVALTFTGQGVYGAFNSSIDGPATDNDGDTLVTGTLYFNTTDNEMRIYDGANWIPATSAGSTSFLVYKYVATGGQTTFTGSDANSASLSYIGNNIIVFLNGVKLDASDFTATSGTSVVLGSGATASDELVIIAFKSFEVADTVPASTGGTFSGNITIPTGTAPGHAVTKAQLDASGVSGITSSANGTAISIDSSDFVTIENKIKVDDIEEKTSAHGVEIDGVLVKDGGLETSTTGKIKQKGAFMQSSTHQALTLGY